jgi:maleylacetate reductase
VTGLRFDHDALPGLVLFGAGRLAELPAELERLGSRRPLLVVAGSQAETAERFAAGAASVVGGASQHVPVEEAEAARRAAAGSRADGLVALGGGSAIGLAKAVALTTGLPLLAVPTTYSGSEMTMIWGLTEGGRKTTGRDPAVLPRTVIYDPELTRSLPVSVAAPSGMNALAHAVESLWVEAATPLTTAVAEEAICTLAPALRRIAAAPEDFEARERALAGAWLAASALAVTGTGLHHKTCHVLGGLGLPHAETHAVLLPYSTALCAGEAAGRIARALGEADAVEGLLALSRALGIPRSLAELGLTTEQAEVAAGLVADAASAPPDDAQRLLEQALRGGRPDVG